MNVNWDLLGVTTMLHAWILLEDFNVIVSMDMREMDSTAQVFANISKLFSVICITTYPLFRY